MTSQENNHQSSWKQWLATLAATSVMLSCTFDAVWASRRRLLIWGSQIFTNTIFIVIGSMLGAVSADIYGRKRTLLMTSVFAIPRTLSWNLETEEWGWVNELFMDIGSGIACTVVPLYISEIANVNMRGALLVLQLSVHIFGILFSDIMTAVFELSHISEWIDILNDAVLVMLSLFHVTVLAALPETPQYLNWRQRYNEAAQSLAFYKGIKKEEERRDEIWMDPLLNSEEQPWKNKFFEIIKFENRRSLTMIFLLIGPKWFCGQQRDNFDLIPSMPKYIGVNMIYINIGILAVKLIFTFVIMPIIGYLGRKLSLMIVILFSCIATVILLTPLSNYHSILGVCFFVPMLSRIILTAVSLDYVGKLFSINVRAIASAIVISFDVLIRNATYSAEHILSSILLSLLFFFSGIALFCAFFFVLIFFPKTDVNASESGIISTENSDSADSRFANMCIYCY